MSYLPRIPRNKRYAPSRLLTAITTGVMLGLSFLACSEKSARAQQPLESDSYEIQLGNFNMTSGSKSGGGYTVTDTVGQTAAGEFNSSGYSVFAGFQYLYTLPQFSFTIDDLTIELGELVPGNFSSATNLLTVNTRSGGYVVKASADHPLRTIQGSTIPFTGCDSGCSISAAGSWTNPSNIGFGFHVAGANAASDFLSSSYFRPFADLSNAEDPQIIGSSTSVVQNDTLTVTYRATIDGSIASGQYETAVTYIAIPSY